MSRLEDIATKERKYPLDLVARERRALEMSKLKLSEAGVREVQISRGRSIWTALKADGVGTKILLAEAMEIYNTVGIDAVAMVANDVLCVGAKPILTVDYLAQNQENNEIHRQIISGVEKGCETACAELVGGETATLSDMIGGYGDGYHFDLATACFGVIGMGKTTREGPVTGDGIEEGDVVVGLRSSGLHSNGFLWVRPLLLKEFNRNAPYTLADKTPSGRTLGDELLTPALIYVSPVLKMMEELSVKGASHITGGAFRIKLPRIAPAGVSFVLDNMPEPPWIFREIQKQARCTSLRMYEALNMGVGMCIVVSKHDENECISIAKECGHEAQRIGYVRKDTEPKVYIPSEQIIFDKIQ